MLLRQLRNSATAVVRTMARPAVTASRRTLSNFASTMGSNTTRRTTPVFASPFGPTQQQQCRSFASEGDVVDVPVPSMGDSITEGTLVEWSKDVGDYCAVDDVVAVIETDKVSIDVRTDKAGTLEGTMADIDETVAVGAPLYS